MFVYELFDIRKTLDKLSNQEGIDFAYAIFKNKQIIDNKTMELDFIKNVSKEIIEYEEKRIKICEQYSKKNENGQSIIENDTYSIIEDSHEEFETKMKQLYDEYKIPIEDRRQQIEIFNKKMNSECELNFYKLKKEQIPNNIKTATDLEEIAFMIE